MLRKICDDCPCPDQCFSFAKCIQVEIEDVCGITVSEYPPDKEYDCYLTDAANITETILPEIPAIQDEDSFGEGDEGRASGLHPDRLFGRRADEEDTYS